MFCKMSVCFAHFFGTFFAVWFVSSMELEGADVLKNVQRGFDSRR